MCVGNEQVVEEVASREEAEFIVKGAGFFASSTFHALVSSEAGDNVAG